jgi:hypothetical protein
VYGLEEGGKAPQTFHSPNICLQLLFLAL